LEKTPDEGAGFRQVTVFLPVHFLVFQTLEEGLRQGMGLSIQMARIATLRIDVSEQMTAPCAVCGDRKNGDKSNL
jgi:hypothetical protein